MKMYDRSPGTRSESEETPRRIVIVNAGTSSPSSSRMLADRIAQKTLDRLGEQELPATVAVIELGPLVGPIGSALVSGGPAQGDLLDAVRLLSKADGIIATTPIYKAGMSGLFKSFIDVLDNDLLIAKPVVLAATAGSVRHALVADDQMRPLFAFMRALTTPTSVFAAPEDWADTALSGRIVRAATELAALVASGVGSTISGNSWGRYQHAFGSNARPADAAIDFDTDLMRLATGGTSAHAQDE